MANLKRAHEELFRRSPDECFDSLPALLEHCRQQRDSSRELWQSPDSVLPQIGENSVRVHMGTDGAYALNHWSFSQLCGLCGVSKDTINVLSPDTASRALMETRPRGTKPMQVLVNDRFVRAMHGTQYSRLWNCDLLDTVQKAAPCFGPPQTAVTGGTGLYSGEQDMFIFVIDPAGWIEIGDNAFAPGLFAWNSEVGKRSLGVETFWLQAVCQNHIVWDATDIAGFSRKHTGNIVESLAEVRQIIEAIVAKRDSRRDEFAKVIAKAMQQNVGDAEEATKFLDKHGISRKLVKDAVAKLGEEGKRFTLWTLVDALTQLTQQVVYAGDRTEADRSVSQLLSLAA
jgi:hypothetical protein